MGCFGNAVDGSAVEMEKVEVYCQYEAVSQCRLW
jgi:hypothetical protein